VAVRHDRAVTAGLGSPRGADADVVVVGGGHNGLVCATYLARSGLRVTMLEARSSVGGCASTVDAIGARVNICNCDHYGVRGLPLVAELDLAAHGLRYIDLEATMLAVPWEGRPWVAFHDVERTLDGLARTHPDQVAGYRRFVADVVPMARLLVGLAGEPPSTGGMLATVARSRSLAASRFLTWSRTSAAAVLARYFTCDDITGPVVATGPAVWGVSPHQRGTGIGVVAQAMKHVVQPGRPVGGSGALTDSVAAALQAAGGVIRTGATVDRIVVEGERVAGAVTQAGDAVTARCVVVACDPRAALLEWVGPAPSQLESLQRCWRARPVYDGYESKVDAVVAQAPVYRAAEELGDVLDGIPLAGPTAVLAPTVEGIAAARAAADRGRVAARPIMLANVPSVLDPAMRAGQDHVLSLEVLFTPYELEGGWPDSDEPRHWLSAYATAVDDGFTESIGRWRAMTPDRYEAEFRMPRGHAASFAGGPVAALLGRQRELSRYRTPLRGLYLTGAATFPGAGVWGASGRNTAHVVMRDLT
jgi:phytoene dehydrogenase-like protein